MRQKICLALLSFLCFYAVSVSAQELTQTIRGTITDQDSKILLVGANVIVVGSNPVLGASTDVYGRFRIENVPAGRISLKISILGYEDKQISNILVETGKEKIVDIELSESVVALKEASVSAQKNKSETINKMATVSAKTFTVEETNRYSGSLNDPARMVSAYAGVSGDAMGNNDIVVRGNSPRGILWRLEGVDIPNPNHFANEGSTGGPVNTLNGSMLANSDFFTGAFAPEYGNAYSGIFDVKFRNGNNEKREYAFSLGVIGTDFTAEGPFKEGYAGSYLLNYRYSSLDILSSLGILDFGGIPRYQDASFKLLLPTKAYGNFSVFGLGGISSIKQSDIDEEENINYGTTVANANLGIAGLTHSYIINENTYIKSYISASSTESGYTVDILGNDGGNYIAMKSKIRENKYKVSTTYNRKLNAKNNLKSGIILTRMTFDMKERGDMANTGQMVDYLNEGGGTYLLQAFTSWKYRLTENLTMVSGIHYTQFMLNNDFAVEPRIGMKWQFLPRQNISLGVGLHSKLETISTYLATGFNENGTEYHPNENLGLTKAAHFVAGYGNQLGENMHLKVEVYYQHLYDVPVENDPTSSFSISNYSQGYTTKQLVNEGTGRNYGLEFTVERFLSKNFYCLFTASLYKSKYTAMDGIERNSRYDANYATNILAGKEFRIGSTSKGRVIALNTKLTLLGAERYTPIDLDASNVVRETVYYTDKPFSKKGDDVFYLNIGITYRVNRKKATHEFKLDVQNITNNQAVIAEYYNERRGTIEKGYQLPMIPNIIYTIKF